MGTMKELATRLSEGGRVCPFCEKTEMEFNRDMYDPMYFCPYCGGEVRVIACETGLGEGTNTIE